MQVSNEQDFVYKQSPWQNKNPTWNGQSKIRDMCKGRDRLIGKI